MSSFYNKKLKQRDSILKKYIILSSNYKNRYLKKKNYHLSSISNRNTKNKNKNDKSPLSKSKKNSNSNKKDKLSEKNKEIKNDIFKDVKTIIKEEEKNLDFTNNDNYNNTSMINYNIFDENNYMCNNNNKNKSFYEEKRKNLLKYNLKKYINIGTNTIKTNFDYLNKKFYHTEKPLKKIKISDINNSLKYLKLNKSVTCESEKARTLKLNYIKSPTINFYIENLGPKLNTIPYETKNHNYSFLTKETREQFSMEKDRTRKFNDLIEDDNIFLNFYPDVKNKVGNLSLDSNKIEYITNKNKDKEPKIKEIIILNPNNNIGNEFEVEHKKVKKEINEEKKMNDISKRIINFNNKFKRQIKNETNKNNNKYKISVKVRRLVLDPDSQDNENYLDKNKIEKKGNVIRLSKEKIKEKAPFIYIKKTNKSYI